MKSLLRVLTSLVCASTLLSLVWSTWSSNQLNKYVSFGGEVKPLQLCRNTICLTSQELAHLRDVQVLLHYLYYFSLVAVVFLLTTRQEIQKPALLILYLASTSFFLINFKQFFLFFHYIFFPQGNWAFSTQSYLIQHYPSSIWFTSLASLLICSFLINILLSRN